MQRQARIADALDSLASTGLTIGGSAALYNILSGIQADYVMNSAARRISQTLPGYSLKLPDNN